MVLAGGFALGVVLISSQPGFTKDLTAFLVGSILTVQASDLVLTAVVGLVVVAVLAATHKELVLGAFDPGGLAALGYPVLVLDGLLLVAIEATVVTAIPTVGTILAVALIVAPAATARLWTDRIGVSMAVASTVGALSGVVGLVLSSRWDIAAGPTIAVVVSSIFHAVSPVVSPRHGLLARMRPRAARNQPGGPRLQIALLGQAGGTSGRVAERFVPPVRGPPAAPDGRPIPSRRRSRFPSPAKVWTTCSWWCSPKNRSPVRCENTPLSPCTPDQEADIVEAGLADTLATVAATPALARVVALDGRPGSWLPEGFDVVSQRGGSLGNRLFGAFEDCFHVSEEPVVLIGMDTPQVRPPQLLAVQALLEWTADAVVGLAPDGGYWVIGLRHLHPGAFAGVPTSADDTGSAQLGPRLQECGYQVALHRGAARRRPRR